MKKLADQYGICIFIVHHTRKERDGQNPFNDVSGTMAISGVGDTNLVLRRDNRFGEEAVLSVTGRDIEERQLKMRFKDTLWEVTEELNAEALRRETIPPFVFRAADLVLEQGNFFGTISALMKAVGEDQLSPSAAGKALVRYYSQVFLPVGIRYESKRSSSMRLIRLTRDDSNDGNDARTQNETLPSRVPENSGCDSRPPLSPSPSLPSFVSWQEVIDKALPY